MLSFIFLFYFNFIALGTEAEGFSDYNTKTEVPEPLFIDLVRSLNARKGEWEVNSLFYHSQGYFEEAHWAPEIEWVFADNLALEFELPMVGATLKNYKAAFQATLHRGAESAALHGLQVIYETDKDFVASEATLFYILAYRFSHTLSTIGLIGAKSALESYGGVAALFNQTLFYNYSRQIDLGLEVNLASGELGSSLKQIVPQLHLAMGHHYKMQFGIGGREIDRQWAPISTLRLIKEFNK